jgi:hypothetical protein
LASTTSVLGAVVGAGSAADFAEAADAVGRDAAGAVSAGVEAAEAAGAAAEGSAVASAEPAPTTAATASRTVALLARPLGGRAGRRGRDLDINVLLTGRESPDLAMAIALGT